MQLPLDEAKEEELIYPDELESDDDDTSDSEREATLLLSDCRDARLLVALRKAKRDAPPVMPITLRKSRLSMDCL
jgi:hypothetical protein